MRYDGSADSGGANQGLTGAYCIKAGTQFSDSATSAGANACPKCGVGSLNCGNANNTGGS